MENPPKDKESSQLKNTPPDGDAPPWIRALPNQLTILRMAAVPILLVLFPLNIRSVNVLCAFIFMLAAMTDWLDGFIARRFNVESRVGAILDPIADKLITGVALILVAANQAVWAWMAGFLLVREIGMSGLRLVALEQGIRIPVSSLGKWKTLVFDVAIVCLMVNYPLFGWPFKEVGMISIWLTLVLSYYSAYLYVKNFWNNAKL